MLEMVATTASPKSIRRCFMLPTQNLQASRSKGWARGAEVLSIYQKKFQPRWRKVGSGAKTRQRHRVENPSLVCPLMTGHCSRLGCRERKESDRSSGPGQAGE